MIIFTVYQPTPLSRIFFILKIIEWESPKGKRERPKNERVNEWMRGRESKVAD